MTTPHVYQAITAVTSALAAEGISKDRKNDSQNYKFRGIDDVFTALSRKLADNALCILPRVVHRETVERKNAKGTALFYTTLTVEFDFVSAKDGSKHTICMVGEAMDSGDKSCNKAMSAAYKYAALQAFCIPTEGDNDADATTHEVAAKQSPRATEEQVRQLEDWAAVDDLDPKLKDRIAQYLAVHKDGKLSADRAAKALHALQETK